MLFGKLHEIRKSRKCEGCENVVENQDEALETSLALARDIAQQHHLQSSSGIRRLTQIFSPPRLPKRLSDGRKGNYGSEESSSTASTERNDPLRCSGSLSPSPKLPRPKLTPPLSSSFMLENKTICESSDAHVLLRRDEDGQSSIASASSGPNNDTCISSLTFEEYGNTPNPRDLMKESPYQSPPGEKIDSVSKLTLSRRESTGSAISSVSTLTWNENDEQPIQTKKKSPSSVFNRRQLSSGGIPYSATRRTSDFIQTFKATDSIEVQPLKDGSSFRSSRPLRSSDEFTQAKKSTSAPATRRGSSGLTPLNAYLTTRGISNEVSTSFGRSGSAFPSKNFSSEKLVLPSHRLRNRCAKIKTIADTPKASKRSGRNLSPSSRRFSSDGEKEINNSSSQNHSCPQMPRRCHSPEAQRSIDMAEDVSAEATAAIVTTFYDEEPPCWSTTSLRRSSLLEASIKAEHQKESSYDYEDAAPDIAVKAEQRARQRFLMLEDFSNGTPRRASLVVGAGKAPRRSSMKTPSVSHTPEDDLIRNPRRASIQVGGDYQTTCEIRRASISFAEQEEIEIIAPIKQLLESGCGAYRSKSMGAETMTWKRDHDHVQEPTSIGALWYNKKEMQFIQMRNELIVKEHKELGRLMTPGHDSVRGLEWKLAPGNRAERQRILWENVLELQRLQTTTGKKDAEYIRRLSMFYTSEAMDIATKRAGQDAKEIAEYLQETQKLVRRYTMK